MLAEQAVALQGGRGSKRSVWGTSPSLAQDEKQSALMLPRRQTLNTWWCSVARLRARGATGHVLLFRQETTALVRQAARSSPDS